MGQLVFNKAFFFAQIETFVNNFNHVSLLIALCVRTSASIPIGFNVVPHLLRETTKQTERTYHGANKCSFTQKD